MYEKFYQYEKSLSSSKKRDLGIVYTPFEIVDQINSRMLSNWASDQPPKVLDPCCGTGIFLFDMAHKISEKWSMPIEQVYKECIYGFDIDAEAVDIGLEIISDFVNCYNTVFIRV